MLSLTLVLTKICFDIDNRFSCLWFGLLWFCNLGSGCTFSVHVRMWDPNCVVGNFAHVSVGTIEGVCVDLPEIEYHYMQYSSKYTSAEALQALVCGITTFNIRKSMCNGWLVFVWRMGATTHPWNLNSQNTWLKVLHTTITKSSPPAPTSPNGDKR